MPKATQLIKRTLLTFMTLGWLFVPSVAIAQTIGSTDSKSDAIRESLCAGANLTIGSTCQSGGISDKDAQAKINGIIRTVINIFSLVVGVISVIMIIIGGLKYITSGGDSGNVTGAKNTILYAIIGLVVVAMAQFMVRFVITKINAAGTADPTGTGLVN